MQLLLFMLHLMFGGAKMKQLLKLDSSPMGEHSISRKLTAKFGDTWLKTNPDGKVIERDLSTMNLKPVDAAWITAAYTPEESRTEAQKQLLQTSDSLIADLQDADEYVFGVPMHNFGIPSTLKLWIDQIARAGKTFSYGASGPKGLLTGKKATLLIASAGMYGQESAMASWNFVAPYLKTVFGFLGVTDLTIISAEGLAQLRSGTVDPVAFLASTMEKVHAHASL
jgi:FMN-dependent NADH-azoreductase